MPITASELREQLDLEQLREWVHDQRWYASKSRQVTGLEVVDGLVLRDDPILFLALVQARFATGTHELYQLILGLEHGGDEPAPDAIAVFDGWSVLDALADPHEAYELLRGIDQGDELDTADGRMTFHRANGVASIPEDAPAAAIGVEQSNTSIVFDSRLVLKVFRKLESGINPELEVLRFLTAHGFENIAPLHGWYEYEGASMASTLGVVQRFLPTARGGWEMTLDEIDTRPEELLELLGTLGTVTAELHTALASDASDPAFSPEEPSQEALALLTASVDEDIERIFVRLPDDDRLAPIIGRGQEVRERLALRAQVGVSGRVIRTHGDYHLGQTLHTPTGWVIIDFEGEPARALPERRAKRSPLRDVASMLRSFAYVTSAVEIQRGKRAPEGFEDRAREVFLHNYLSAVDQTLLPAGEAAIANLLTIFELEKAIYELRYELDHRPDWVAIPVAGIARLLES